MPAKLKLLAPRLRRLDTTTAKVPPKRADPFYLAPEWRALVARLIRQRGRRCECCGATHDADGQPVRIIADHVVELKDGGAPFDPRNIRLMAAGCHNRKTAKARDERFAKQHRR
jgi:hypothetical protein